MYKKPSEEMIALAMDYGWSKEEAERGYTIFNFDGTGLLERMATAIPPALDGGLRLPKA